MKSGDAYEPQGYYTPAEATADSEEAPPGYNAAEPLVLSYPLTHKDGKTWATLRARSRGAPGRKLPMLVEGDALEGSLDLDLVDQTAIKSLTVSVSATMPISIGVSSAGQLVGNLVSAANVRYEFVRVSQTLWEEGKPLPEGAVEEKRGKVKGSFSLPFSLELPQTVSLPDNDGNTVTYPLPSYIFGTWTVVNIAYTLTATINHGSFLHPDHTVSTNVAYIPRMRPDPPSEAMRLAYEEGAESLLGPDQDPDGWEVMTPVVIEGKGRGGGKVEATLTLALAKPLAYSRGGVIPLHLTITCPDDEALAAISTSEALNIYLLRVTRSGYDVLGGDFTVGMGSHAMLADAKHTEQRRYLYERVQKAVWWSEVSNGTTRTLQGEIHLSARLDPTTHLGMFDYAYEVVFRPPEAEGFKAKKDTPLQAYHVRICTMYADGPRPVAHVPPTYDEIQRMNQRPVGLESSWANFY